MAVQRDQLFLLFFRVAYLSILAGHTAFTLLGFAKIGTSIGIVATILVAVGSEFALARAREEGTRGLKEIQYMV
jgi:hypothetical protein